MKYLERDKDIIANINKYIDKSKKLQKVQCDTTFINKCIEFEKHPDFGKIILGPEFLNGNIKFRNKISYQILYEVLNKKERQTSVLNIPLSSFSKGPVKVL